MIFLCHSIVENDDLIAVKAAGPKVESGPIQSNFAFPDFIKGFHFYCGQGLEGQAPLCVVRLF